MGKDLAQHWQQWNWPVTAAGGSWTYPLVKWYDTVRWKFHYPIFSQFWYNIGSLMAENRQFCLLWPWNPGQGLLKVNDFGTNGKRVYTFLLVSLSTATVVLSCTVSEIWRLKFRKSPILPTPPSFNAPTLGNPLEFLDKTYPAKTRGMGLPYGENFII